MRRLLTLALLPVLAACGGDPTSAPTVTETVTITTTPTPDASGYPKVVPASSLPDGHEPLIEGDPVVAVAPSVWAPLPEGTSAENAAEYGELVGPCAAVKPYIIEHRPDEDPDLATCW